MAQNDWSHICVGPESLSANGPTSMFSTNKNDWFRFLTVPGPHNFSKFKNPPDPKSITQLTKHTAHVAPLAGDVDITC